MTEHPGPMHLIKKYANRKLYHTNQKQYITLDGIARLVQEGEAVQVLENETGEDITAGILAQVVLQARGRSGPQLPTQLLTGLIQIGGDTIANLRRSLATSLGGAEVIEAEINRRIDHLVASGGLSAEESRHWRQLLTQTDFGPTNGQFATDVADVPSRNDVVVLHAQVDALAQIIDELLKERQPGGSG
jgi:polyhydroxyalkanoate synthesis repressor PhaR